MKILLRESKEFDNFKSGKYLRDGKWIPAVAYNEEEGWVIVRITAKEYAKDMYYDSVEELMSDCGYDAGTPKYIYLGYDLERAIYDDGEGESAVVGMEWEDGSYAHYGVRMDNDHTTFDNMVKAIVVNGLDLSLGDYSASKSYVKRVIKTRLEGLKPTTAKAGDTYVNTHNLTFFYIFDSKEKANSANYWDEAILSSNYYSKLSKEEINSKLDFIEHSSFKDNVTYNKNFTTIKITPGLKLELVEIHSSGRDATVLLKIVGTDYYLKTTSDSFKYLDLDTDANKKDDRSTASAIIYAIYGTGNMISGASRYDNSIKWHWTTNIDNADLNENQFKQMVRRTARRKAEQDFEYFDPNNIVVKFFKSRESFIKFCNNVGLHPDMKNVDDYISSQALSESF